LGLKAIINLGAGRQSLTDKSFFPFPTPLSTLLATQPGWALSVPDSSAVFERSMIGL
jgi:hypothetical protein